MIVKRKRRKKFSSKFMNVWYVIKSLRVKSNGWFMRRVRNIRRYYMFFRRR